MKKRPDEYIYPFNTLLSDLDFDEEDIIKHEAQGKVYFGDLMEPDDPWLKVTGLKIWSKNK